MSEQITDERLAEIRELLDNINERGRYSGAVSPGEVIYSHDVSALLAEVERLRADIAASREQVYDEIQEFVVLTSLDTTVGQRIDEFITNRLIDLRANDPAPHTMSNPFIVLDPVGPEDEEDGATE